MLEGISVEDWVANFNIEESELPYMKGLGVQWDAETDVFILVLNVPQDTVYRKLGFLQKIAALFDSLQMLAPFTR